MASIGSTSAGKTDKAAAATTGGAISISAFASFIGLCCIGPWAVALFGVSGAITMARWAPIRPYILSLAAIMLVWAFWRVYRPQPVCEDGSCSSGPSSRLKVTLWLAAVMVILAFFADQLQWLLVDPTPEGLRS
jgi:mercuric ion transport protein